MTKNKTKKEIKERETTTQKLRDKLWKIEDEEYLGKVKKVLGNFYLKTYGRGKNKEYSFTKLIGINKKIIETIRIYVSKREKYGLSEVTSGKRITKKELLKQIKKILENDN